MKVAVIDVAASVGGAASILKELYQYIKNNETGIEWVFVLSQPLIEPAKGIEVVLCPEVKKNWGARIKFDLIGARKILEEIHPDLVFNMQNTSVGYKYAPEFLYVQQPIPFQKVKKFSFLKKEERVYAIYQHVIGVMIKESIKRVDRVFVQTEWMKNAVMPYTSEYKVDMVKPNIEISGSLDKSNISLDGRHFFFPTNKMPYKNHRVIVNAVKQLVGEGIHDICVLFTLDRDEKLADGLKQIKFIGTQDKEQVMQLYTENVLVFPSYIETFGLPLAEARAVGTVILAADTAFSREILRNYENAYFFDAFNPSELAELMKKIINKKITALPVDKQNNTNTDSWGVIVQRIKEHLGNGCTRV